MLESEALRQNLRETAVSAIEIDPRYQVLRDAVRDYQGLLKAAEHVIYELHHPFVNWNVVIGELRDFALKNLATISRCELGVEAVRALIQAFGDAVKKAPKETQKIEAIDGLMAFLQKIVYVSDDNTFLRLILVLKGAFSDLLSWDDKAIRVVSKSSYPLPRTIIRFVKRLEGFGNVQHDLLDEAARLVRRIKTEVVSYWLGIEDPGSWFIATIERYGLNIPAKEMEYINKILEPVSHAYLKSLLKKIEDCALKENALDMLICLALIPDHVDMVRNYRLIAHDFAMRSDEFSFMAETGRDGAHEIDMYLFFLFHLVEMEGLAIIHEEIFRQINRRLLGLVRAAQLDQLQNVLPKSFSLLKIQVGNFPKTAIQCIEALGAEIFKLDNPKLIELFLEQVVDFGFQIPGIKGVDVEWHILCNPAHLENIRAWLRLICQKPKDCSTLLSTLIINIKLAGTCIRDTDLFQKDISLLLNSKIEPVYNLIRQFVKIIPVYFNEIGAEGLLRDVSTEIDEISRRQDALIHFLRKQSHVESNNLIVDFIEAILCFWYSGQKEGLIPYVPAEVLEQVRSSGPYVDYVQRCVRYLAEAFNLEPFAAHVNALLNVQDAQLSSVLDKVSDVPLHEKRRVELLIKMYRLETFKYKLGVQEIRQHLEDARRWGFEGLERVLEVLDIDDPEQCLDVILDELEALEKIILSPEHFEAREDVYYKRHIAVDIPSMYGRYHERKFDALSLSLRLEGIANMYFEQLVAGFDVQFITREIFVRIARVLRLFWRAVQLNGMHSRVFHTYLTLFEQSLTVRRFTFSQYMDIVKGLSEGVKDMINIYYISPHQDYLSRIIKQIGIEGLLPKYKIALKDTANHDDLVHQISERFFRDLISESLGLQSLDNFISKIYQILCEQKEALSQNDLELLLSYESASLLCPIHSPASRTRDLIHLGNKGFNLVLLAEDGAPVPPGTIITTEFFRCYPIFQRFQRVYQDFERQLRSCIKKIEAMTGMEYGNPSNPLFLSVRSSAAISMPGMMSTIINVGSNLETIQGFARKTGNVWFAWDNYRRFLQSWGMIFGMDRDVFTMLMKRHKDRYSVAKKREFSGDQMKELAMAYRQAILDHGLVIEEDPFEQLLVAIRMVMGSWDSDKARTYREIMGLSDYWGTAVIVQAMVYGNFSESSGTGVVFTANPKQKLDRVSLWGDFTPGNQGEDIVSGLVTTYPISIEQKEMLGFDSETSLEESFPEIYGALLDLSNHLICQKKWSHQEIEFTFQGPRRDNLYILQTRNMTTKKRNAYEVFVPTPELDTSYVGRGIGVSGGALSGKAVFNMEEIEDFRAREPETPLIFIRSDTVPDDIKEISMSQGLLTAKGGQTSHAAIVAFVLDKVCVVGCKQLMVFESEGIAKINGKVIHYGDYISIDGRKGMVYLGRHPILIKKS
ncbi:MAG: PEP/pyruvate-binding domain-containing protein [Dissulfurimicrobium sp.]|uniref:PEP/pyruvate-binding domain-containing protein n=1 Tax=Dissulfurimicrobium sp. TaxID=2022436 RepID=UPI00404B118A